MADHPSLKEIYDSYSGLVYNLALNYVQNGEDAEEITQDVFLKVHRQMDTFRGDSKLKTWLYKITVNQCLDHLKARKRKKRFGFRIPLFSPGAEDSGIEVPAFDHPGIQLEDKEALEGLFKQINSLPERQKTVLLLKAVEDLSVKEISEVMDLSEKAVESLLSRSRASLKKKLAQNEGLG